MDTLENVEDAFGERGCIRTSYARGTLLPNAALNTIVFHTRMKYDKAININRSKSYSLYSHCL